MSIKPQSAFFIFLGDFSRLHRTEYNSYPVFTAAASDAWRKLNDTAKKNYEKLSRLQCQEYKIKQKLT